ncbi:MAG: hypothetical protein R3310_13165 [Candidatus Competibacteraceae bacterium]|nr:hypothetical protein [Candidatus Competibacteraceae bacterium]
MIKLITALALSVAALSAQAQGFNDRTDISFGAASQTPRMIVQAQPGGFNDRDSVTSEATSPIQKSLGPRMTDAVLKGFNDKNDA